MSLRILVMSAIWLTTSALALAGDSASGTITFKTGKCAVKHGWLVRGPDEMDSQQDRPADLPLERRRRRTRSKRAKPFPAPTTRSPDGAMVDFSDARHLAYAVRLNGERLQYSGGTDGEAFTLTTSEPDHLADKVHIDDTAAGGAKSTPPSISPS